MKLSIPVSVSVFVLSLAISCAASCDCEPTDQRCIDTCVTEANSCVTSCKGDTSCYEECIDKKWPSGDMFHKNGMASPSSKGAEESKSIPTAAASGTVNPSKATPSASASNSAMLSASAKASETAGVNGNNKSINQASSGASSLHHHLLMTDMGVTIAFLAALGIWIHV